MAINNFFLQYFFFFLRYSGTSYVISRETERQMLVKQSDNGKKVIMNERLHIQ